MASRKLNVLVYTGSGSTVESVKHALFSLRRLLSPNYAVIPVTEAAILKEPWTSTCALLVFPGGADLGYCKVLNGPGNSIIKQYVRAGGAYLGFCAGGYYGSKKCEFEVGDKHLEVVGSRELAFYPGTARGGAFKGFRYQSESGARAVRILTNKHAFKSAGAVPDEFTSYYNGGSVFVTPAEGTDVEVLATYGDDIDVDGGESKAAVVYCKVGLGSAVLTGPHPEFSAVNLSPQHSVPGYNELIAAVRASDQTRTDFLKACLTKLGLEVSQSTSNTPSLSKLHLSCINSPDVDDLVCTFDDIMSKEDGEDFIKGEQDTFHLEKHHTRWSVNGLKHALPTTAESATETTADIEVGTIDYSTIIKNVVIHDEAWPEPKETPYFNHAAYYAGLRDARKKDIRGENWGDHLLYGEVVTSTNTLLEKNHSLLSKLPSGFTFTATTSVAARGRGSNVWIAPPGSLLFSVVINHPAQIAATRPIVFIQYLSAIAVIQAIKSYGKGYETLPVKLKWPNDIYAADPRSTSATPSYVKIGGILANCAYSSGNYQVVLGIGLNTTNGKPTTSLDALLPKHLPPFSVERLLARLVTRMEVLYRDFVQQGFTRDMEGAYYDSWLHGNQVVTLEQEAGARAKIVGITRDWGMLMAQELDRADKPTGKMWALQSDENSFDFFKGLVKRKI
ncbi:biotin-protein ligase [Microdochium bolleyi]|uniref:Biotin-protein ligase n=1 Tax=Microdochium bolleyi TaxID=196109 RepID=A0A136JJG7_9PEZI|nr:biotin-protein ligase [Microdochium bolleyi]